MMKNILITGASGFDTDDILEIENLGFKSYFIQQEESDFDIPIDCINAVICNNLFAFHNIKEFKNLEFIQLTSAGLDRVPIDYIKENKIIIKNARGVYNIPMAEFVISGVLDILKYKFQFMKSQMKGEWNKNRKLVELYGQRCLVIGCGSVGIECAKRLQAFGCNLIGIDNHPYDTGYIPTMKTMESLDSELKQADIIVVALPLTEETFHLFDVKKFKLLKRNAIFVNVSRGKIVCEEDLISCIDNIGGAVLDVFEEEPLKRESLLWNKDNVIVTPHNSFVGNHNKDRLLNLTIKNLKDYINLYEKNNFNH